ncbi:MAG: hypothetical protein U0805_21095 [Pirellulales bacterium]
MNAVAEITEALDIAPTEGELTDAALDALAALLCDYAENSEDQK